MKKNNKLILICVVIFIIVVTIAIIFKFSSKKNCNYNYIDIRQLKLDDINNDICKKIIDNTDVVKNTTSTKVKKMKYVNQSNYKTKNINMVNFSDIKIIDSAKITIKENEISRDIMIKYYDDYDLKYDINVNNSTLIIKNTDQNHNYYDIELTIFLPKNFTTEELNIDNIFGDINIELLNFKKIVISSHLGIINILGHYKYLNIKTIHSNIKINGICDDLQVDTLQGYISCIGNYKNINLNTTHGNVYFSGKSDNTYIKSINGNVNCDIQENKNKYYIDLNTKNGKKEIKDFSISRGIVGINKSYNNKKIQIETIYSDILVTFSK